MLLLWIACHHGTAPEAPPPAVVEKAEGPLLVDGPFATGVSGGCAVSGGRVACWGDDAFGLRGTRQWPLGPSTAVEGISDAVGVAVGMHHACALHATGEVSCWGLCARGAVPGCSRDWSPKVRKVPDLTGVEELAASSQAVCARRGAEVLCWGAAFGERQADTWSPVVNPLLAGTRGLDAGDARVCGLREGSVACDPPLPVELSGEAVAVGERVCVGLAGAVRCDDGSELALGGALSGRGGTLCGLDPEQGPWCWGEGIAGLFEDTGQEPVLLKEAVNALQVGYGDLCLRREEGQLDCFGRGGWGRIEGLPPAPADPPPAVEAPGED